MIGLGHTNENGLTESRYLKAKFFRSENVRKKNTVQKRKKKTCQKIPKTSHGLGKKNLSTKFQKKKKKKKFQKKDLKNRQ